MSEHLWGIVDMGSNGIRFSITSIAAPTARILPALWQDRVGISLYDAQYPSGSSEKHPIPDSTIQSVVRSLKRFQRTCDSFSVSTKQRRIIATEATRLAINSEEYRAQIKKETGLEVEMLPKEDEGRVGAFGVVASFESVRGVVMDLGGGSTQITWMDASKDGDVKMSQVGSVSMPYGAAALTRRLGAGGSAAGDLRTEITAKLKDAIQQIQIPKDLMQKDGTLNLYLSGGGFRGWGFVLMSQNPVSPYPIPIINGFKTRTEQFQNVNLVTAAVTEDESIFRVSERRASQVPAVALLVSCLVNILPTIGNVHFAQGGVREGILFRDLPREVQAQHPMDTVTKPHSTKSADKIYQMIKTALPSQAGLVTDSWVEENLVLAFAQAMFIHSPLSKDVQAASALRTTTTGTLSSVLGADHEERAVLGIMLCERWGGLGALSPGDAEFYNRLLKLLMPPTVEAWWAMYIGRVGALIAEAYPAGVVDEQTTLDIKVAWGSGKDEKPGKEMKKLQVNVTCGEDLLESEGFAKALKGVEKLGKKKNWSLGAGYKVELTTQSTKS